ncbi:MAG: MarR family transcriptional regulator [Rhizobiaceae bacterium]|nr:MarR family transcriptional regulator [Rhizobiaceae bacterium]
MKRLGQTQVANNRLGAVGASLPEVFALTFEAVAYAKTFRRRLSLKFKAARLPLTPGEARVLALVARNDGLRQSDLAQMLSAEPMALGGMLHQLEAAKMVRRDQDEVDRRAKRVHLTSTAAPMIRKMERIVRQLCAASERGLEQPTVDQLRDALSRMRKNLVTPAVGEYPERGARENSDAEGKEVIPHQQDKFRIPSEQQPWGNRDLSTWAHRGIKQISPSQCRMARAGLDLSVRDLARLAQVSGLTVTRFENGSGCSDEVIDTLTRILEAAGVEFIEENGEGVGVKIRK